MRILVPTDVFPPRCGGSGWSSYYLAKALKERGHEVTAVVPKPNVKGVSFGRYSDIDVIFIGYHKSSVPLLGNRLKNEVFWKGMETFLNHHLARNSYDIIHAQHQMTTVPSVNAGKRRSIPVVATIRDYWPVCYFGTMFSTTLDDCGLGCSDSDRVVPFRPFVTPYIQNNLKAKQSALRKCSHLIAISNFVKTTISKTINNEISVIPNVMEPVKGKRNESDYVFYAGTISKEKGILLFLDSLRRMKNPPRALIAGDGYLMQKAKRKAIEQKLDVNFLGRLSHDDIINHMLSCKVFVLPSIWHEPLSRTLIEASMLGIPIVATNTGGTPDIIKDRKTGILSKTTSIDLSRKLSSTLNDKGLRTRIGKGAQRNARKNLSKRSVTKKLEKIYEKLV